MVKPADNRDPLLGVASSISDHTEVDWKDVEREVTDEETTAVVMQLQIVERIARLHAGGAGSPLLARDAAGGSTPPPSRAPAASAAWLPRQLERVRAWASNKKRRT